MSETEIAYLDWIKEYTNNPFIDGVPRMVNIVIQELIRHDSLEHVLTSQSLGDASESYANNGSDYPVKTLHKLKPYIIRKPNYVKGA